ncbi:MAG: SET domain-containing protein-lysine N-methyltransferase [Alphaproteobacteria bacterium]
MMLVETFVGPSAIEGVGVFAVDWIKAGTRLWTFDPRFDLEMKRSELAAQPACVSSLMVRYAYPHHEKEDVLVLESDNGRFMNHSFTPNTDFKPQIAAFALRDIAPGEEITCDYREFDQNFALLPSVVALHEVRRAANGNGHARRPARRRRVEIGTPAAG